MVNPRDKFMKFHCFILITCAIHVLFVCCSQAAGMVPVNADTLGGLRREKHSDIECYDCLFLLICKACNCTSDACLEPNILV